MTLSTLLSEFAIPPGSVGAHTPHFADINGVPTLFFSAYDSSRRYTVWMQQEGMPARKILSAGASMCAPWVVALPTGGYRLYATVLSIDKKRYEIRSFFSGGDKWGIETTLEIPVAPNATSPCLVQPENHHPYLFFTGAEEVASHLNGKLYRATTEDGVTLHDIIEVNLPAGEIPNQGGYFKPNIYRVGVSWVMYVSEIAEGRWYCSVYRSDDLATWRFSRHLLSGDPRFMFYKPALYREEIMAVVRKDLEGNATLQFDAFDPANFM